MKRWDKTHKQIVRLHDTYKRLVRQNDELHRELCHYPSKTLEKRIMDNISHQKKVLLDMRMLPVTALLTSLTNSK